jgi:proline iminopeptidase
MDPKYMEWKATEVQKGTSVITNGSHCTQNDDPKTYFTGLIKFIKEVNDGKF